MTQPGGSPPDPGAQADPLVGTVLAGRYRILERLGAGAMGTVYLGEHVKIGRKDAIKVLKGAMARDPESMARFTRGARNLSQIRHPNVCTLYDFGDTSEGTQFLAIEYVPGGSLADVLEQGPLGVERAVRLAIQIADGLQAAHDQGIVHRDLKPDNVMLMRDRRNRDLAKVVDFDIAKGNSEEVGAEVTRLGNVIGTPQYMSPEQLTGDRLDGRSDVYSLGVVLFRMLTGTLPFEGASTQELMIKRLTTDPFTLEQVLPGRFPSELDGVLQRALTRRASERTESAEAFADELRALSGVVIGNVTGTTATTGAGSGQTRSAVPPTTVGTAHPHPAGSTSKQESGGRRVPWAVAAGVGAAIVAAVALVMKAGGPAVESLDVLPAQADLGPTESIQLVAEAKDAGGIVIAGASVTWASEDVSVASVDERGRVQARGEGTTTVRGESDGVTVAVPITVLGAAAVVLGESDVVIRSTVGRTPSPRRVPLQLSGRADLRAIPYFPPDLPQGWLQSRVEQDGADLVLILESHPQGLGAGRYAAEVQVSDGAAGERLAVLPVTLVVVAAQSTPPDGDSGGGSEGSSGSEPAEGGLDPVAVRDIVDRFALELAPLDAIPARALAARDSARTFWSNETLDNEVRAWSAYAVCLAELNLGDNVAALAWIERALRLSPGQARWEVLRDRIPQSDP